MIEDCRFYGTPDAGVFGAIILGGAADAHIIRRNIMIGAYSVAGIMVANGAVQTNLIIEDNVIINTTAASEVAISLAATTTGQIANNSMGVLAGTAPIVAAAASWCGGNYYRGAVATAGTLI